MLIINNELIITRIRIIFPLILYRAGPNNAVTLVASSHTK